MTLSHADVKGECDLQLNKTISANLKKKKKKSKFNYATTAVPSGIYTPGDPHVFCECWAVKKWKEAESTHGLSAAGSVVRSFMFVGVVNKGKQGCEFSVSLL